MSYSDFVAQKLVCVPPTGISGAGAIALPPSMFDFQRALATWALRRGRAAIFADTGLGKSRMQLAWADAVHRETGHDVLILAPLAVAAQTVGEGAEIGVPVHQCRDGSEVVGGITITNYDRLHRFDASRFGAVVLDESSIIKHHTSKTLQILLEAFAQTAFKLCATATPAPNDWTELGTHAEFLGICTQVEMLSEFFVHDGGDTQTWRLKGHARQQFWRWVASWAALVRKPSDLGFDDSRYNLPALHVAQHVTASTGYDQQATGMLFALEANTLSERRGARRASLAGRVEACALLVKSEWAKLAANREEHDHAVEEAIRGKPQSKDGRRPGVRRENKVEQQAKGSRGTKGVHAALLQGEPGEIQGAHSGTAGEVQRQAARGVQEQPGSTEEATSRNEGVASKQSGETARTESSEIRTDTIASDHDDGKSESFLRDMRMERTQAQDVSDDRSLSQDDESARDSLLKLQHGDREVQGQPRTVAEGGRISLEPWLIWCDLNAEQDALEEQFGDLAFSVRGSDDPDVKESRVLAWLRGERPVMISKSSIMGFGLNFQHCARMAFVGVTDSWEAYYQAVRRCWRFGQAREVNVHIFASDLEGAVVSNLQRKERDALAMADALSAESHDAVMQEVTGVTRQTNPYSPARTASIPAWLVSEAA